MVVSWQAVRSSFEITRPVDVHCLRASSLAAASTSSWGRVHGQRLDWCRALGLALKRAASPAATSPLPDLCQVEPELGERLADLQGAGQFCHHCIEAVSG